MYSETKMSLNEIAKIARDIAAERAFDYAGNFGRGTFRFEVQARVDSSSIMGPGYDGPGSLMLTADCNAQIDKARAITELNAVWNELVKRIDATGYATVTTRGHRLWSTGFWHMGHWSVTGYARGLQTKRTKAA